MSGPSTPVFATHAAAYALAGWTCVLPVPVAEKFPPPVGFTGAEGRDTAVSDLVRWAGTHPGHSIALRMPFVPDSEQGPGWTVIGIDVDAYAKGTKVKHGDRTLTAKEAEWGALPATWRSTARGSGPSGIRFYLAPARRYGTLLKAVQADGTESGDVEIIQRHHRYAVVWPSPHPGASTPEQPAIYQWYDPQGQQVDAPPKPHELPWLPLEWVNGLAEGASQQSAVAAPRAAGEALLDQLADDFRPACVDVANARTFDVKLLETAGENTRHDVMAERTFHVVQMAAAGHPGAGGVIEALRTVWNDITAGESREEEFERALLTAAQKAVTEHGAVQVPNDPCELMAAGVAYAQPVYPAPLSGDPGNRGVITNAEGESVDFSMDVEPPRWASIRQVLGAHAFDPQSGLDQPLAEAVIERTYPMLRFAYDSKSWLLRAPDRWELHDDLARWAVAQVSPLMPFGDPEAEKGSDEFDRAKRRGRLMTNAGAGAVSSMMNALVAGGMHPASLSLSTLDADPEVMWAGGVPWSLRFSDEQPVAAEHIDPNMPHLHTAPYAPRLAHTPRWDAFLEAVWPDPEVRAWAVRVLSVAMTGYADRALPILLGSTGRGKTQVVALLMSVLGTYAHAANPKLLHPNSNEHDTIVFDLKGRRLSFIDEAPAEAKTGQERLKQLTGGGELTGRQMGQNSVTFAPTHTFVLTANDPPTLTDAAVRSRARLIPCEGDPEAVRQARAAIGHVTGPAWRSEAPGVLAMMMREAAAWLHDTTSASVDAAPLELRYLAEKLGAEQDPVMVWITNETEEWPSGTGSTELYQQFTASCLRNNLRRDAIPSMSKWGRTLTSMGFPPVHTKAGNARGLRVRPQGLLEGMEPPKTAPSFVPANPSPNPSPKPSHPQVALEGYPLSGEGLTPQSEGLVKASSPTLHPTYPQVSPTVSLVGEGYEGYVDPLRTQETPLINEMWADLGNASTLHRDPVAATPAATPQTTPQTTSADKPKRTPSRTPRECSECGGTMGVKGEHDDDCATGAAAAAKNAEAKSARAVVAEEKRIAAVAEASGPTVGLPAVVTRDGVVRPVTLEQADQLLTTITGEAGHGELTVDIEHTGYPIGHRNYAMRTIQLGDENIAVVLDHAEAEHNALASRHLAAARELHAHSAGADISPLAVAGLLDAEEAWSRMTDTGILAKIADPASTGNSDDLKGLAKALLPDPVAHAADQARSALFKAGKWKTDIEVTHDIGQSGWAQVDHRSETMARYDGADVLDCAAISRRLPALAPDQLLRERTAQRMTARVGLTGFRFVPEQIDRLHDEHTNARRNIAGLIPVENPGSNDQLGMMLASLGAQLPATSTGKPSVAKGVLEPLAGARGSERTWEGEATSDVQAMARLILDWRHADTALKLFLDPWRDMVRNGDGRARSTVHTLGADTGRMSAVRWNLQQISREGGMRACISADPGYLLITADFASVEVRVAAGLSQDPALIKMLLDGVDMHGEIAKLVWGPNYTKAHRYLAKRKVFGRIYGQGLEGMARTDGAGVEVAKKVITAMDALTPGLTAWSSQIRTAVEVGHTQYPTYAGRVVHLPKGAPHAGPNYAIQGTARELLIDALMRWDQTPWGGCTLMPVHDEILVMVPEDQAHEATAALKDCMASTLYGLPIVAEADEPSFEWKDSA